MMQLRVTGNGPLKGDVQVSGAKNAALPSLAACILTADTVQLSNLPIVQDIHTMCSLLGELGFRASLEGEIGTITCSGLSSSRAPYELVKTMRASILVLGPLLGRFGHAQVSLPGGCAIGARPVDLHLKALEKMGADIQIEHGYIKAKAKRLKGTEIFFEKVTVTGTENLMMAAALAEGRTVLQNAAREPEIEDLANLLNKMGARISGQGTPTITIQGVAELRGTSHEIIPDRIEAGTYIAMAAITCGHVRVNRVRVNDLKPFLEALSEAGLPFEVENDVIEVFPHQGLLACDIQTQPHPGFPTDMQAQYMAVMTQAKGRSAITEAIFENRFMHVPELERMGADIRVQGRTAMVSGPTPLSGAQVRATDLRASASLVVAGLVAKGRTTVERIYHLDRGYSQLEKKLHGLGALIERVEVPD